MQCSVDDDGGLERGESTTTTKFGSAQKAPPLFLISMCAEFKTAGTMEKFLRNIFIVFHGILG